DRMGHTEDLLVGEVGPGLEPPQARGHLELAAPLAPARGRRSGRAGGRQARQSGLLEEALAVPLQPVEGGAQVLLPLAEDLAELAVAPAEDLLERLDAPPQPLDPLLVPLVQEEEGMDRGAQGRFV